MSLPNPDLEFTPYNPLSAGELNDIVENVEALADGTGLNDGVIVPKSLASGTGTSWVWQPYTPTFTNLTVGNAVQNWSYCVIGKTVFVRGYFTLGTTSSMGTNPTMSLPVTAKDLNKGTASGTGPTLGITYTEDNGSTNFTGPVQFVSTSSVYPCVSAVAGTYATTVVFSAIQPMTWVAGDEFRMTFAYESA